MPLLSSRRQLEFTWNSVLKCVSPCKLLRRISFNVVYLLMLLGHLHRGQPIHQLVDFSYHNPKYDYGAQKESRL